MQSLLNGHLYNWPQELSSFNDRDIKWCYNYFGTQPSNVINIEKINTLSKNFNLAIYDNHAINVNGTSQLLDYNIIIGLKNGNVVDISWVDKKDGRLLNWLMICGLSKLTNAPLNIPLAYSALSSIHGYPFTPCIPHHSVEQQYDFIIDYIDSIRFCVTDASYKQSWLNVLKNLWGNAKTPAADLKWLEQGNEDQLLWAWNYLKGHSKSACVPPPANRKEYYNAILASLDAMTILDASGKPTAEKQLFIKNFSKAWSQKKFRAANKVKKPYHLPLTIKAKSSLAKLALLKACSESDLLEDLIRREYAAIYLDSQGNEKY